jgi:hypothetical protein
MPQHKEIHCFSIPKVNTYIVCIYPCVFHLSLSIHQCWAVLSLPKQEPAGQGQVYRPFTGGSHTNKEHVLSCNSWFSKTQKIGQIMNHQFCQKTHQSFEFFQKTRTFTRSFILNFLKTWGLEVINLWHNQRTAQQSHTPKTNFFHGERVWQSHGDCNKQSMTKLSDYCSDGNHMEIKVLNNHDVSCMC